MIMVKLQRVMTVMLVYFIQNLILNFSLPKETSATVDEKAKMDYDYQRHQDEKNLSRTEKANDKEKAQKMESNIILAFYDLQAVMPVPSGNSSAFFSKSRLNCFNFTVCS